MASYFLPSFLSGWDLSTVSAFSLSAGLQKRILSYLLKRTLGHLVDGGQVDLAQIDAGIGSGRIEIRNIQLNADAINSRLPSLPVTFVSGQIGKILIHLPVPNLWSGELSITISDISAITKVSPGPTPQHSNPTDDLSASFASAASQILVEDEEAKELEESIHESLGAEELPEAQQQANEEPGSLIATYVEALLTRLRVAIENVHVQLLSDAAGLSVKLRSLAVQSSNTRTEEQAQQQRDPGSSPHKRLFSATVRKLELQGLEVWLEDKRATAEPHAYSSSSSEASTDGDDSIEQRGISQDLEQSVVSLQESSASLYASAIAESVDQKSFDDQKTGAPRHPSPPPEQPPAINTNHLLLSLGQEPVVVTFKTLKERQQVPSSQHGARRPVQRLVSFSTDIDVQIGNGGTVLFIDHASLLLNLSRKLTNGIPRNDIVESSSDNKAQPALPFKRSYAKRKLELSCHISSFNLIIGYDDPMIGSKTLSSIDAFWTKPSRSHPDFGHLRLRCDKLSAVYRSSPDTDGKKLTQPSITLTVEDLGLFEYLSANLYEQCPPDASRVLPVLILDPNLIQSTRSNLGATKHSRHDYASSTVDVFDWRFSGPHHAPVQRPFKPGESSKATGMRATRFGSSERRPSFSSGQSPYYRTAYGERGWKLKPQSKPQNATQSHDAENLQPNVTVSVSSAKDEGLQGRVTVAVAPIHLFVDVSLVTRLMLALRKFAAAQLVALKENAQASYELSGSLATLATSVATIQASASGLLDDIGTDVNTPNNKSTFRVDLKIRLVRLEIRTPRVSYDAAALVGCDLTSARRVGLDRRSGILVLQVQGLDVRTGIAEPLRPTGVVRFAESRGAGTRSRVTESILTGQVSAEKVSAYYALPSDSRALVLALIEGVHDNDAMQGPFQTSPTTLLPQIRLTRSSEPRHELGSGPSPGLQAKDRCNISIPSVKVELGKQQLDSLQYMADDLTQSVNLWSSDDLDDADSLDTEGLKILGSRFFGSRAGMSIMSASTDSTATARASSRSSSLLVTVMQASIRLWLPSLKANEEAFSGGREASSKSLLLLTSDFELLFDSDKTRNITRIEARLPQMQLSVEAGSASDETTSSLLAYRTMERSLDDRDHHGMLLLVLEAYADPGTSYREQNVDLTLCSITLSPSFDEELIPRVKRLFKAPAGVFENVEPNEVTRISFKAKNWSIYVAPPGTTHRGSLAIGEASVKTKLTSHAPKTAIKLAIGDFDLYAIESEATNTSATPLTARSAAEYWTRRGFARIIHVPEGKGSFNLNTLTRPEVDVKVTKLRAKLQATADTLDVVTSLVGAITAGQSPTQNDPGAENCSLSSSGEADARFRQDLAASQAPSVTGSVKVDDSDRMAELMSGIEDNAYRLASPLPITADLVDDDVPSDAAFLGAKGRYHPEIVETTLDSDEFFGGESVASLSLLAPRTDTVIFADEDVTVRLLDPKGICPVQEYFTNSDLEPQNESALGPTASSVRVRVSNFDLSVRLHSGYDWETTRKAVQQEAKLVRKRLQKIKQLLAEGQVPDDSVEAATSNLLDSIHISLPQNPDEMDADAMMQAVEDEFGDHLDAASTADSNASASWQALPTPRRGQPASRSEKTMSEHTKLHRSARSLIDFNFRGLEVEFDRADPQQLSHVMSRIAVNARRFEIIDNIKTSTWRTFLTEMQDRNTALRHDSENKMVKVEILNVRPQGEALGDASLSETPEVRMRAKISPLRLHVDQDALDFLKKFFTFKPPGQKAPATPTQQSGPTLPFVQFAEVLPIKIKLDYKPKRVDYNLLRQGKTIELMNFFHFEGSEMVLRHITLRGINGWPRLFDTLNDIWTPDVKANQLADFLSGLGPIRSLVNVGAGLANLVLLPIEQYHKDGRVLRGMQKGAASFAKITALEAVRLGARLATGTQVILEQAEHILGGEMPAAVTARAVGPDSSSESYESLSESIMVSSATSETGASWLQDKDEGLVSKYASQPDNMRDALSQAYSGLTEGLTSAAQTILAIPMEVYEPDTGEGSGTGGSAGGGGVGRPVVKAVPIAILRGARGATQAIAKTMQGVQVTLGDLENVKAGKYKQPHSRHR
ncbi:Autophagy-related protein 2 [Ustilago sp. UG-2017a]|nr:Autophagy-related protein 2 [Ustilago sp. UG-2017a]